MTELERILKETLDAQTNTAKFGILFSWLIVPIVLLFVCAFSIWKFYPLHGDDWKKIKEKLTETHMQKQQAYEEEMRDKMNAKQ